MGLVARMHSADIVRLIHNFLSYVTPFCVQKIVTIESHYSTQAFCLFSYFLAWGNGMGLLILGNVSCVCNTPSFLVPLLSRLKIFIVSSSSVGKEFPVGF